MRNVPFTTRRAASRRRGRPRSTAIASRSGRRPPSAYTGTRVPAIARANPSQPSGAPPGCVGVGSTGPSTAKSSRARRVRELVRVVARAPHEHAVGRAVASRRRRGGPVHAVAGRAARVVGRAVQQHARAVARAQRARARARTRRRAPRGQSSRAAAPAASPPRTPRRARARNASSPISSRR